MLWLWVVVMWVMAAAGHLVPYDRMTHRMTAATLSAYVNKTFGPLQKCLKVAIDDSSEASAIMAMLHNDGRTIVLDDGYGTTFCPAYLVAGRKMAGVERFLENFRNNTSERMLVLVVQDRKYIKPFIKYLPTFFNYKDVILISVNSQKETVFQLSLHYGKFVPISKQQDQWFRHDLEGKKKVKNFYKTRIKLLAYNNSFFSSVIKNRETGKLHLSNGVECSIFKEIASKLNITWDVYTTDDMDKWGTVWSNDTITGGALKWLSDGQADVSFCSLWIEYTRLKFIDMSRFWALMCLKFLVPKPQPLREKWDLLFKPFPLSLWLLVLFSAMLTTITVWLLAIIQKKIGYERINTFTSLSSTIFLIIGMMLLTSNPSTHRTGPIRHLISWWCLFIFIISTSFSSVLYSYITSNEYTDVVLEVDDMVKANYQWGVMYPSPSDFILKMQNPVHRAFSERFVLERSENDRIERLKRGKYAMLTKCLYEKHFMESENVPAVMLNDLRTVRTCLNQFYIGIGFVKHSPYVKSANLVIQRIAESGLIDYWLSRVIEVHMSPATFKQVYEIKPHKNTVRPSALSYRQYKVVMVVWMIGCVLSTVVFVAERHYGVAVRQQ